jgi:hypothetical protein
MRKLEIFFCFHKHPPLVPILRQINPVYTASYRRIHYSSLPTQWEAKIPLSKICVQQFLVLRMPSSWMLRRVALVRTDVSEEHSASFIRATRIGEIRRTLALTSNRRSARRLISEAHFSEKRYVEPPKYTDYHKNHPDGTARGGTSIIIKNCMTHQRLYSYIQDSLKAT